MRVNLGGENKKASHLDWLPQHQEQAAATTITAITISAITPIKCTGSAKLNEFGAFCLWITSPQFGQDAAPEETDFPHTGHLINSAIIESPCCRQKKMVARTGIEPVTHGFSVRCSTNLATPPHRVVKIIQISIILNIISIYTTFQFFQV